MADNDHLWIIAQYATHRERGPTTRHFKLAQELHRLGYKVTIFAASGHHLHSMRPDKTALENGETIDGVQFQWIKVPNTAQGQIFARVLAWIIFSVKVYFTNRKKPSPAAILHSSPSLLPFIAARFLAHRHNVRLIFEFRDIWPMSFWMVGGHSKLHPFVMLHGWIERWALRVSDHCIATMPLGWRRLQECGVSQEKFSWIANGYDPASFDDPKPVPEKLQHLFSDDRLNLMYLGTMGQANALDLIIDAATILRNKPVRFILVGDGSHQLRLEKRCKELGLANVVFHATVPKTDVPALLKASDAQLISWPNLPLYGYGTSANKMPEYLASARPIIQAYSGAADVVVASGAGFSVAAGDSKAFSEAIMSLAALSEAERYQMGRKGKAYALDHYSFAQLAEKLISVVFNKP